MLHTRLRFLPFNLLREGPMQTNFWPTALIM